MDILCVFRTRLLVQCLIAAAILATFGLRAPVAQGVQSGDGEATDASGESTADQKESIAPDEGSGDTEAADAQRAPETQDSSNTNSDPRTSPAQSLREGFLIQVPLPITQQVDTQVRQMIEQVAGRFPVTATSLDRPIIVLEFQTVNGATGEGSQLERCLSLARYLSGPELSHIRTVAYIPEPRGLIEGDDFEPKSNLRGHAILVAIACEELVMHDQSSIGAAGIDEAVIDDLLRVSYKSIAERRRTLQPEVVTAFLDPGEELYEVRNNDGTIWLNAEAFAELDATGEVFQSDKHSDSGSFAEFTSSEMLDMRLIRHRVSGRSDLASRFNVPADALQGDPSLGGKWNAVSVRLEGPVTQEHINWAIPALDRAATAEEANMLIIRIDSNGGSLPDSLRLAQKLADFDETKVRTVAFVNGSARGGAAVVALACDHLIMTPDSIVGGPATPELPAEELDVLQTTLESLAEVRQRDWSLFAAVLDPERELKRYQNTQSGQLRLMLDEQRKSLDNAEEWAELGQVATYDGIDGSTAAQLLLARHLVSDFEEFKSFYQLTEEPRELEPTLAHRWIEEFGRELASPWIAGWLLFAAMFFLSTELSQPGVGIPGFISAICFLLFFWSQYCDGNVQWFEVLLLVAGAICLLLEVFVLPGFGVFGVGGILMILASLVLAMQTFVIPSSSEDMQQIPGSIGVVVAGLGGMVIAFVVVRRFLPHVPVFNRMILTPPTVEPGPVSGKPGGMDGDSALVGKEGVALTPLTPSGKALIDNRMVDVITDGRLIDKDQELVVQQVLGNRVIVMPVGYDEA